MVTKTSWIIFTSFYDAWDSSNRLRFDIVLHVPSPSTPMKMWERNLMKTYLSTTTLSIHKSQQNIIASIDQSINHVGRRWEITFMVFGDFWMQSSWEVPLRNVIADRGLQPIPFHASSTQQSTIKENSIFRLIWNLSIDYWHRLWERRWNKATYLRDVKASWTEKIHKTCVFVINDWKSVKACKMHKNVSSEKKFM